MESSYKSDYEKSSPDERVKILSFLPYSKSLVSKCPLSILSSFL